MDSVWERRCQIKPRPGLAQAVETASILETPTLLAGTTLPKNGSQFPGVGGGGKRVPENLPGKQHKPITQSVTAGSQITERDQIYKL